jgi:hypothetical protein
MAHERKKKIKDKKIKLSSPSTQANEGGGKIMSLQLSFYVPNHS